jgi:hypothetical protein
MLNHIKGGRYFADLHKYSNTLTPMEIWNITILNLEHRPGKVMASEGTRSVSGRTGNKREGLTVLPCVNAAGEKNAPLLIVKWKTGEQLQSVC